METKLYRIMNAEGLFSKGGTNPSFTKRGKIWTNIGHVKSHIHMLNKYGRQTYRNGCVLQTYYISETVTDQSPVAELMAELAAGVAAKEVAYRAERAAEKKATEIKQLRNLQQKYPEGK